MSLEAIRTKAGRNLSTSSSQYQQLASTRVGPTFKCCDRVVVVIATVGDPVVQGRLSPFFQCHALSDYGDRLPVVCVKRNNPITKKGLLHSSVTAVYWFYIQ